jgi:hypothetical protein
VIEQSAGREQIRLRSTNAPAAVDRRREMTVHENREEPIGPARMSALARRIDFRHLPPHANAILEHGHLEACDALVGNIRDVLRVMQEGDVSTWTHNLRARTDYGATSQTARDHESRETTDDAESLTAPIANGNSVVSRWLRFALSAFRAWRRL